MKIGDCILLCLLFVIAGCAGDRYTNLNVSASEEYYPLIENRSLVYRIDSIVFDDAQNGNIRDTISYELEEKITSSGIDTRGDTFYILHRFRKNDGEGDWKITDAWTIQKDRELMLRREENLLFLKMQFPLRINKTWHATQYIDPNTEVRIGTELLKAYDQWQSFVTAIDHAGQVGTFEFPEGQLMTIQMVDQDDDLTKRWVKEIYARGIGLVERRDTILDSKCIEIGDFTPCIGKSLLEHASKGYILHQYLIRYE